jgi:hypothetical protein
MKVFIELVEMILPPGWAIYGPEMAPDVLLQCPHGHIIEHYGRCHRNSARVQPRTRTASGRVDRSAACSHRRVGPQGRGFASRHQGS